MLCLPIGNFEIGDEAIWAKSPTQALRELSPEHPVTTADDYGAINIWIDNSLYVAEFHQYCVVKETIQTYKKKELRNFLLKVWPIMKGETKYEPSLFGRTLD